LPAAEMLSGGSRADSVVRSVFNYLTDGANRERLNAIRKLILVGQQDRRQPDSLRIRRDVLQYAVDPFLVRVVSGFGAKLFGAAPQLGPDKALADSGFLVPLQDLGHGTTDTSTHLYLAFAKVPIADDMWGRLSISAPDGKRIPNERNVIKNFVTTSRSL